jgi:L-ascorbate metabolism protein UlaG (beta-lactamase superfamily)
VVNNLAQELDSKAPEAAPIVSGMTHPAGTSPDTALPTRRAALRLAAAAPALWRSGANAPEDSPRNPPYVTLASEPLRFRRTGWAGVQFEWGDKALFIDPKLKIATTGDPRLDLASFESAAASRFAAITHLHRDHFDVDALKKVVTNDGEVICHASMAPTVAGAGLPAVALANWEPHSTGGYDANSFALAPGPVADGWGDPQVAWIVSARGKRFIHCGDTAWTGAFFRIGKMYGPFSAAFLPINGVVQHEGMYAIVDQPKTMTPEQAIDAAVALGAGCVVPVHYGATSKPSYLEVTDSIARARRAGGAAGIEVRVLAAGDWIEA